jgi:hypothetical protein
MQLDNIKEEVCSECGAETIGETKTTKHCNGHFDESRRFNCGRVLKFSPNFMVTDTTTECPNNEEVIKFKQRRKDAKEKLSKYINSLDVDEVFKTNAKANYRFI